MTVSVHSEPLRPHIPTLSKEMHTNQYVLPEVQAFLSDTTSHVTIFRLPTFELKVIGCKSRDIWMCQRTCRRAATIQALFPTSPAHLSVWVFLTDAKRTMPASHEPIQPKHINGGYTYIRGHEIYVLRREEFPKVVLHETIHHTQFHTHDWSDASLRKLYGAFNISQHKCSITSMDTCSTLLEPNEAVVETWAETLHIMFMAVDYKVSFATLYKAEVQHAFQQTQKILAHQRNEWSEGTHAYSYIVLRTLLLATFASWAFQYNTTAALTSHIIQTWEDPRMQASIQSVQPSRNKSLRMTLLGDL